MFRRSGSNRHTRLILATLPIELLRAKDFHALLYIEEHLPEGSVRWIVVINFGVAYGAIPMQCQRPFFRLRRTHLNRRVGVSVLGIALNLNTSFRGCNPNCQISLLEVANSTVRVL